MEVERDLGFEPADREFEKLGYDIESKVPCTGRLRFIEVKGRATGEESVTVTKNEILTAFNKPDDFILAIVEFLGDGEHRVHYLRQPLPTGAGFRGDERELQAGRADCSGGEAGVTYRSIPFGASNRLQPHWNLGKVG